MTLTDSGEMNSTGYAPILAAVKSFVGSYLSKLQGGRWYSWSLRLAFALMSAVGQATQMNYRYRSIMRQQVCKLMVMT